MENKPIITTIIPTYRRPLLLKRAIKSALNQSFRRLQVCVYDNASGDETKQVVEKFALQDNRVKYFCHNKNIGSGNNFQFGLENVDTPFFSFLSDDDFLLPEFYEKGIKNLKKYPEAAFFAGKMAVVNPEGKILGITVTSLPEGLYTPKEARQTFAGKNNLTWTSILFNTEKAKKIGPLDLKLFEKYGCASDLEYIFRLLCYFPIVFSNNVFAAFQSDPATFSGKISTEEMFDKLLILFENLEKKKLITVEEKNDILTKYHICYFNNPQNDQDKIASYDQIRLLIKQRSITEARKRINDFLLNYQDGDAVKKLKLLIVIRKIPFLWFFCKIGKICLGFFKSIFYKDSFEKLQNKLKQLNFLETK